MNKVIVNSKPVDFDAAVSLMDDDIREHLNSTVAWDQDDPKSYQNYVNAYCVAHAEKFGEDFQPLLHMITVHEMKASFDWNEAFAYAQDFTIDDVVEIRGAVEGENDGDDWIAWGRLRNGVWFCLKAGCDYTGWDCRASGTSYTASTRKELIRMGMDFGMRQRFGIPQPDDK